MVAPGAVRVVVSRTRASVPNCPNWRDQSRPNWGNHTMSNYGCGVNAKGPDKRKGQSDAPALR